MTLVGQFVLYNLLPSLLAGFLIWLVVYGGIILLQIKHTPLRLPLLFMPLIKSILVLLGIGLVFPWPRDIFVAWHDRAVPFTQALPIFLVWISIIIVGRTLLVSRAKRTLLQNTKPPEQTASRLIAALDQVMAAQVTASTFVPHRGLFFCTKTHLPRLQLLISNGALSSPLVFVEEEKPTIIFPANLIPRLNDLELQGALAHEMSHIVLHRPVWCTPRLWAILTAVSPIVGLVAAHLRREEEKACDEMAVASIKQVEAYTEMLLKSYRYAQETANAVQRRWQVVPQLLGFKPMLSERVEHLLQFPAPNTNLWLQRGLTCVLCTGVWIAF